METCIIYIYIYIYYIYIYISRFDHATSMVYVHDETVYLPRNWCTAYPVDLRAPSAEANGGALWNEARVVDEQWEHHKTSP